MNKSGLYLNLFSHKNNYNGIFRFKEDNNLKEDNKFIQNDCYIFITENNDIKVYQNQKEHLNGEEFLFQVKIENNIFKLSNPNFKNYLLKPTPENINIVKNKLWYVVNPLPKRNKKEFIGKNEEYYLNEGDIFKMGTEIFYLTKINIKNYSKNNNNIESLNFGSNWIFDTTSQIKIVDNSKLCNHIKDHLKEGKNLENIHKIENIPNEKITIYKINLTKCKCEKCDKIYPLKYKLTEKSEIKELVHIEEPGEDKNYIKIESLEKIGKNDIYKYIYIIKLTGEDEEFIFDNKGNNIPININSTIDKILKLFKSSIKYDKKLGKLILENLGEETGTLIFIKNNYFEIPENKEIFLQSRNTFFKAKIMNKEEYEK